MLSLRPICKFADAPVISLPSRSSFLSCAGVDSGPYVTAANDGKMDRAWRRVRHLTRCATRMMTRSTRLLECIRYLLCALSLVCVLSPLTVAGRSLCRDERLRLLGCIRHTIQSKGKDTHTPSNQTRKKREKENSAHRSTEKERRQHTHTPTVDSLRQCSVWCASPLQQQRSWVPSHEGGRKWTHADTNATLPACL